MPDITKNRFFINFFWTVTAISLIAIWTSVYLEKYYLAIILPVGFILFLIVILDFSKIYYLLLFLLPLSIEYVFPNGLGTDLPTEPLMILMMVVYLFYILIHPSNLDKRVFNHPITILLFIHLCWILSAALFSTDIYISIKFLLAKTWYITAFFLLTSLLLRSIRSVEIAFWCIFIPLLMVTIQSLVKHSFSSFDFDEINHSVYPFFRNHVNYAAMLTVFFPFLLVTIKFYKRNTYKFILLAAGIPVFLSGIYFSYTRTAWVALLTFIPFYILIRNGLLKWIITGGIIAGVIGVIYLGYDNHYLKFSPDYEKTISQHNIKDIWGATYKREDISSMERIYRWVAAVRMSLDKPVAGFGPNTFYENYKGYVVSSFTTYVSDNPEKSTTHNYFLLILVEQGYIGLVIFIMLTAFIFIAGEKIYLQTTDEKKKSLVLAVMLSILSIYINLMLGDMLEVDKIGSLFFINLALLTNLDINNKKESMI